MSVTIKDCLKLPSLNLGQVIAGHAGLNQIVTTVSVLEFNDSDEQDLINPNELLISSLHCVKDDPEAQCRLLEKAKRSGDVGLIPFSSDLVLKTISPRLIRLEASVSSRVSSRAGLSSLRAKARPVSARRLSRMR